MATDMIEQVAEALCNSAFGPDMWKNVYVSEPKFSEHYRDKARAAIQAMREPTQAMIGAGDGIPESAVAWRAMIDEALKE